MNHNLYITKLIDIYGFDLAIRVEPQLRHLIDGYRGQIPTPADASLSENNSILITYGDQIQTADQPHLKTLRKFINTYLKDIISGIHILPFFPWSSDDGFSVKDYRAVDPSLGDWSDIENMGHSFRLMFDGVINHVSAQGAWFQAFLRDEAPYRDYFLTIEDHPDLSNVVRPRTMPLLTQYQTTAGPRYVWTTFSADQVDLDYHNPDVLLEIIDILLMYAKHGAQFIRLDAIAYLWKEVGTACIHLPQTHAIIQLLRLVFDEVAQHVQIITETNVPHSDNISYFGDGRNEAQLVYNFALPPLVLHTFQTGDASILSNWADELELPSNQVTFFNFLASHDGIGLNAAHGILSSADIDRLVEQTLAHGGLISYKQNSDGTQRPYEMNINFFDALSNPSGNEPLKVQVDRFMAAQAIMLSLRGMPGVYFHSLFGSRGWIKGVNQTKHNRTINRQKLELIDLEAELSTPESLRSQVFRRYSQLLSLRAASAAFHPQGKQKIIKMGRDIFAVLRSSPNGKRKVLCLQNVTPHVVFVAAYKLEPYQTLWIDNPLFLDL